MRLGLGLFLASIVAASPAFAGRNDPEWNPPARFDRPYTGKLTVLRLPQAHVYSRCKRLFAKYKTAATAYPGQKGCAVLPNWPKRDACIVVTIDKTFGLTMPGSVLRHEIGHCNGWEARHPS